MRSMTRQQARALDRKKVKATGRVTPKTSAAAFRQQGRAEGVAQAMAMASDRLRKSEAEYVKACCDYAKNLEYEVAWGYVGTCRPILDCFLQLADQFEAFGKSSESEAQVFTQVAVALVAELETKMPGARGSRLAKRVVGAARALAGEGENRVE